MSDWFILSFTEDVMEAFGTTGVFGNAEPSFFGATGVLDVTEFVGEPRVFGASHRTKNFRRTKDSRRAK